MARKVKSVAMRQLDALGIEYRVHRQMEPTYDAESAARQRHMPLERVVKSLLVKMPGSRYCIALVQGSKKLSLHKLGSVIGQKGIAMAQRSEVARITGYQPGSVSPLGLRKRLPIIMDTHVMDQEWVSVSGGRHEIGLTLKPSDLRKATNALVADITQ